MEKDGRVLWKRPESVPFPTVWRRCVGKKKTEDGRILRFRIQDVTEDMHEELIDMMTTHFLRDEPLCASQNVLADPTSVKEFLYLWREYLRQNLALVAIVEEENEDRGESPPRIAGVNFTGVTLKSQKMSYDKVSTLVSVIQLRNKLSFQTISNKVLINICLHK
jgi:hypothetical protein